MSQLIEKIDASTLPVIITRGIIIFPEITMSFELNRKISIKALEAAEKNDTNIFMVSQKELIIEEPTPEQVFSVGTIAKIKHIVKLPNSNIRIVIEGIARAEISDMTLKNGYFTANVFKKNIMLVEDSSIKTKALIEEARKEFDKFMKYIPKISSELQIGVYSIKDPGILADFICINLYLSFENKQKILEQFDPCERLELLCVILQKELQILNMEEGIHNRVREQIDKNQKDYFLREQLKIIQNELGNDSENEADEYREKIKNAKLPDYVFEKLNKELTKYTKMPPFSSESALVRTYIDTCLEIPWKKKNKERFDVKVAEKILEADHYGLEKVKERILEFIAVKQKNPNMNSQILCLAGPPGIGKTSIASSVARALNRKYVRISLGGIRDEADIRGHRKTYIGAMPGRIITALRSCKSINPLILFDEIDKLTRDAHGDPASALLEVLDSEQNKEFRDHFIEMPIDLSECIFIATANNLDTIPRPLADRMEIITLSGYTRNEKLYIAKNHLISKQIKKHGLTKKEVKISDKAIYEMIDYYTREAGVRSLEREIATLLRKSIKKMITEELTNITVTEKNISSILGKRKFKDDSYSKENETGVANGLAWTSMGGEILQVEVLITDGTGKIELTGSLGDVMKESARTALSFIRSIAKKYGIENGFHTKKDIHIHFPEGAVPKDGPSAGITMATAIFSQLTGYKVRSDVAMTGEITLRGKILPIGGLKEKTVAAFRSRIQTVIIPKENEPDLEDVDKLVLENIKFVTVDNFEEVLRTAVVFPINLKESNTFNGVESEEKEEKEVLTNLNHPIPNQSPNNIYCLNM